MKKIANVLFIFGGLVFIISFFQMTDILISGGNNGVYTHILVICVYFELLAFIFILIGSTIILYNHISRFKKEKS